MAQLRVKNWDGFQHYRDRRPPWIKLHRALIDNMEFFKLSDRAGKMLPLIWVIASDQYGILPDVGELAWRLRLDRESVEKILEELAGAEFIEKYPGQDESHAWSSPLQSLEQHAPHTCSNLLQSLEHDAPHTCSNTLSPVEESRVEKRREDSPITPSDEGVVSSHGKSPRKTRQRPNTGEVVNSDPNVKKVLDSYYAGYRDGHGGTRPLLEWGRAGVVAQGLLASGNDPRLVALVAYLWGKNPPADYVAKRRSSFYSLQYSFNDMVHSLLDGRELDLNSPALPISRFFSDPPAGQAPPGDLDPLSGGHGDGGGDS